MKNTCLKENGASKITLGTVQLGLDYGISNKEGKPSLKKAYEILDAAVEGGINSFDTAAGYGDSETVLGDYFGTHKSDIASPEIITKIAVPEDTGISSSKKLTETVLNLIEKSLDRLKTGSVYCVMLHKVSNLYEHKESIVAALTYAREKKYAKHIGVSVYTRADIDEFLKYDTLDCIQLPINIMDMRLIKSGSLELLKKNSAEIYARSIFLQGLFFMDPVKLPPKLAPARPFLEKLRETSEATGLSIAELAFGYVRDIAQIDKLVIGADNPGQVRENLKLMKSPELGGKYLSGLQECFGNVPEMILNPGQWK